LDLITAKEAGVLWGITTRRVQILCDNGKVSGAQKLGNMWLIPKGTPKPIDGRTKVAKNRTHQIIETDEERRAQIYPVILNEYNPEWQEWFIEEKSNLERLIGVDNIFRISHIGSTAVTGMTAKPTVDIILEINKSSHLDKLPMALASPEYICLSGSSLTIPTPPPHMMFLKGYLSNDFAEKVYHIHVRYPNDSDTLDKLMFRDYLKTHPETVVEYSELKRKLFKDYEYNRDGYTEAKGTFVQGVMKKARKEDTQ